jgi:chemotaxis signal transduction protein
MLMTRVGGVSCAFRLEDVVEIMRPLPVDPIGRSDDPALALIDGVARIRGAAMPVIDARRLLHGTLEAGVPAAGHAARFVVLQAAGHRAALRVDAVIDVQRIDRELLSQLPPLIGVASHASVAQIGARDDGLLIVLEAARIVPDDRWRPDPTDGRP